MVKQKILDKVIKLLALSENNENFHQAEAAKNKAADLMAQYDISIMEAVSKPQFETIERVLNRKAPIPYDSKLIDVISRFNGVALVIRSGIKGKNIFIGRSPDIECNDYMIDIVFQQRAVKWKEYLKRYKADMGKTLSCKNKADWMKSFAMGINSKLRELVKLKNNKIQEHGLVPVDTRDQALSDYNKDHRTSAGKSKSTNFIADGFNSGKSTYIHKGITKPSKIKMLS